VLLGSKLRVEYKKASEKEHIGREKARHRMHAMQLEKEQHHHQRQQPFQCSPLGLATIPIPSHSIPLATTISSRSQAPVTSRSSSSISNSIEFDLNDPSTLEIYSRILLFKHNNMQDELAFSRALTAKQRGVVHIIALKLGLYCYLVGKDEDLYAVTTKVKTVNSFFFPFTFLKVQC